MENPVSKSPEFFLSHSLSIGHLLLQELEYPRPGRFFLAFCFTNQGLACDHLTFSGMW